MTSNLKIGAANPASIVDAVRTHHVDVLMLEELTPGIRASLDDAGLDRLLPHSVSKPEDGGAGTGLWTRFALAAMTTRTDLGYASVSGRIELASNAITLAAIHVYGPSPASVFPLWHKDMERYPAALGALPGPTAIVGGDFNATPDTAQFRTILDHGFADAADLAGAGYMPTWPADR